MADTGSGRQHLIESHYLIGADGAHSVVRAALGVEMEGSDDLGSFERVEFRAPLAEIAGERRYGLYGINSRHGFCNLGRRGPGDRWALARECRPGQPGLADLGEDALTELIVAAAGVSVRPKIGRISTFSFVARIADRYRVGRCFLVGDAAHQMTPRGGTGMNTAIQDAYDVGWKLAWVLRGWADAELLESYEADRRPVGLHNVGRSGQQDGARRDVADALPWDLNGRLAHHGISNGGGTTSTLDLLSEGSTMLTSTEDPAWSSAARNRGERAPISVHTLDVATCRALDVELGGAILVRPDGKRWDIWSKAEMRCRPVARSAAVADAKLSSGRKVPLT